MASAAWTPWRPTGRFDVGACYVCFAQARPGTGQAEDVGWAAAAFSAELAVTSAVSPAGYEAGMLALREGPLLEAAVRGLPRRPDVLLVDATGRDHPRRAGLALQLGAVLDVPTVGLTDRPLLSHGDEPAAERGSASPLEIDGEKVGYLLRTKRGARPICVHAAWRTMPETAVEIVLSVTGQMRTPEPMRAARSAARLARARDRSA
ncbi:MAG TPA: endonuclease V [Gaiellaceae bacterium]|nr:endonuclease V [Gaiellaceae bacterium]